MISFCMNEYTLTAIQLKIPSNFTFRVDFLLIKFRYLSTQSLYRIKEGTVLTYGCNLTIK